MRVKERDRRVFSRRIMMYYPTWSPSGISWMEGRGIGGGGGGGRRRSQDREKTRQQLQYGHSHVTDTRTYTLIDTHSVKVHNVNITRWILPQQTGKQLNSWLEVVTTSEQANNAPQLKFYSVPEPGCKSGVKISRHFVGLANNLFCNT